MDGYFTLLNLLEDLLILNVFYVGYHPVEVVVDLNEPPTNVNNALGIFSTFNATNVFFEFRKQ